MKKTIDEMIRSKTPEEWDRIIKEEMDRLGLKFVPRGEGDPGGLLSPEEREEIERLMEKKY